MVTSSLCALVLFGERPTKLQYGGLALALCSIVMLSL
jgi:multidrug transporter EmrE-like cation transporter